MAPATRYTMVPDIAWPSRTPTDGELSQWWRAMWADVAHQPYTFSDLMPRALDVFLKTDVQLILVASPHSDVISSMWLHDMERENGQSVSAWIGVWVAPAWRGNAGVIALEYSLETLAVPHIFAA